DSESAESSSSESIFSAEAQVENQSASISPMPEMKPVEAKEFFPSLNLMEDFSISDELLGIEDMSVKKTETVTIAPAVVEDEVVQPTPVEEVAQEEIVQEMAVITEEQVSVQTEEVSHVEEVKNELSEQRKGGFRFFANKKVSVLAGVGIVTTFSLIGLFSAGFFSSAVPVGKSNIQEAVQPVVSEEVVQPIPAPETTEVAPVPEEVIQTAPEVTPETVPEMTTAEIPVEMKDLSSLPKQPEIAESTPTVTTYEAGRDYTVIKNTKKNLKKQ
ncbi:MAG: hypothetical protein Q8K26_02200, partial [Candidatus Gracilibacteria bacterium]|nr:hypothetical protein [Candidatus Gracilibacteria bacterium]